MCYFSVTLRYRWFSLSCALGTAPHPVSRKGPSGITETSARWLLRRLGVPVEPRQYEGSWRRNVMAEAASHVRVNDGSASTMPVMAPSGVASVGHSSTTSSAA
jgi:hypothetical protein